MTDHAPLTEPPYGVPDPFTQEFQICDPDGIVRRGKLWKGTNYPCTTHAHFGGEHIRCTTPIHEEDQPPLTDEELALWLAEATWNCEEDNRIRRLIAEVERLRGRLTRCPESREGEGWGA